MVKDEKAKPYLMLLHLHIVVDRWHCPENAEDDVFYDIVRILCKFVFSDAVMQKAALVLSASLNISLEERFSNHLPVLFVVTNQYHDVLWVLQQKLRKWLAIIKFMIWLTDAKTREAASHGFTPWFPRVLDVSQSTPRKRFPVSQLTQLTHWYFLLNDLSQPVIYSLLYTHVGLAEHVIIKVKTVLALFLLVIGHGASIVAACFLLRLRWWLLWE